MRGGWVRGKKSLVGVAIEVKERGGYGSCRMKILRNASAAALHEFVIEHVERGATVITDAWQGYAGIDKLGYTSDWRSQRAARAGGEDRGALLPGVHRVASLAKRWLLGTHQGSIDDAHLQSYQSRVPLQPPPFPQPRAGLLPGARTRSRPRPGALPRTVLTPHPRTCHLSCPADAVTHRAWSGLQRKMGSMRGSGR